ncbi:MAG: preprotein translocase subunit YajC [Campylobacterota bacterium]|nr:preprotein translocase subunit YajC [Campylobacterota bacterium]
MNGDLIGSLLPLIVLFAIFYFLIIRPQQKQQKEHDAMLEALDKGDKIVTNGGLILEITKVEENFLTAVSTDGSKLRVARTFVSSKWED